MGKNGEARADLTAGPRAFRGNSPLLHRRAFQDSEAQKRRRHYRTCPPSRRAIRIHVGSDRRPDWKGFIEDVTSGGARLSFPGEDHPEYALHEQVHLHICSPYLERALVIPSIVCYRYETEDRATYGFEFKKRPSDLIDLPAPLRTVFNRRRDRRVQPAPERPIHVLVTFSTNRFETLAHDISTGGMAFILLGNEGAFLVPGDEVELELRLPNSAMTFCVKAVLSGRESMAEGLRFGASFEFGTSDELASLKTSLAAYVKERRREIARGRRTADRRSTPA